jgi:hypothetical protein
MWGIVLDEQRAEAGPQKPAEPKHVWDEINISAFTENPSTPVKSRKKNPQPKKAREMKPPSTSHSTKSLKIIYLARFSGSRNNLLPNLPVRHRTVASEGFVSGYSGGPATDSHRLPFSK